MSAHIISKTIFWKILKSLNVKILKELFSGNLRRGDHDTNSFFLFIKGSYAMFMWILAGHDLWYEKLPEFTPVHIYLLLPYTC